MLLHPAFDPVAFSLGSFSVHWYGLMYLFAFCQFWVLGRLRLTRAGWSREAFDDLLFYGILGVIVGGRLGEVLFYDPAYYMANPLEIFAVWKGGMSFHGGFLGVLAALTWQARKHRQPWLTVADFVAPLVPLGLLAGRIGNFINGELWGRVADAALPWAMIFPRADLLPRHPSQLYQAALEGLLLFLILWRYSSKPRPPGAISALFLLGYGLFRAFAEFFREPDTGVFGFSYTVSMGQWLSIPMILGGLALYLWAARRAASG
ncbi:MAG: prolipoprotein diacylglyceryl transferase [Betaproteobacteria bacterium]|nr:prolipoprotein diacylglyceryl transferase [Betaproteobacteria bacterium]